MLSMIASVSVESLSSGVTDFPSSLRRFSSPLTRLSKASSTSVFGPRFLGIASVARLVISWKYGSVS